MTATKITEGSGSILVQTLAKTIAETLSPRDLPVFVDKFRNTLLGRPEVARNPKYVRHMAEIIEHIETHAPEAPPAAKVDTFRAAIDAATDPEYHAPMNGHSKTTHAEDYSDLFDIVDPPRPPAEDVGLDEEPGTIDDAIERPKAQAADGLVIVMQGFLDQFVKTRRHPFVEVFNYVVKDEKGRDVCGYRYAVVGTCVGKSKRNSSATFNANCTTQNYRKLKDLPDTLLVHKNGRAVSLCHETADGDRYFLWLLHFTPGLELRFWINVNEPGKPRTDVPSGNVRVRLCEEAPGWRRS